MIHLMATVHVMACLLRQRANPLCLIICESADRVPGFARRRPQQTASNSFRDIQDSCAGRMLAELDPDQARFLRATQ
jgi:hypothetical protein